MPTFLSRETLANNDRAASRAKAQSWSDSLSGQYEAATAEPAQPTYQLPDVNSLLAAPEKAASSVMGAIGAIPQHASQMAQTAAQAFSWALPSLDSLGVTPEQQPVASSGTPAAMPEQASRAVTTRPATGVAGPQASAMPEQASTGRQVSGAPQGEVLGDIAEGDPAGYFATAGPYARQVERETGVPAALSLAISANETGYGQRRYMAGSNNYHGIQDTTGTGPAYVDWRVNPQTGQKESYGARQAEFASPLEGFRAFGRFLTQNPRYAPALERYRQTGDVNQLAADVHQAGYAEDPEYTTKIQNIMRGIPQSTTVGDITDTRGVGLTGAQNAPAAPEVDTPGNRAAYGPGSLTPNQINAATSEGLDYETALAVCGPAAAIAFARKTGRNPTMQEALGLARQVGWTAANGMAGPDSERRLLQNMGVASRLVDGEPDWRAIAADVQRGNPVIVSTPGHYFVAERYDPDSGTFDFGESAAVLKASGGRRWFRPEEIASLGMGAPRASLFMDSPTSPDPSVVAGQSAMPKLGAADAPTGEMSAGDQKRAKRGEQPWTPGENTSSGSVASQESASNGTGSLPSSMTDASAMYRQPLLPTGGADASTGADDEYDPRLVDEGAHESGYTVGGSGLGSGGIGANSEPAASVGTPATYGTAQDDPGSAAPPSPYTVVPSDQPLASDAGQMTEMPVRAGASAYGAGQDDPGTAQAGSPTTQMGMPGIDFSALKPVWDAAGTFLGYVQHGAEDAVNAVATQGPATAIGHAIANPIREAIGKPPVPNDGPETSIDRALIETGQSLGRNVQSAVEGYQQGDRLQTGLGVLGAVGDLAPSMTIARQLNELSGRVETPLGEIGAGDVVMTAALAHDAARLGYGVIKAGGRLKAWLARAISEGVPAEELSGWLEGGVTGTGAPAAARVADEAAPAVSTAARAAEGAPAAQSWADFSRSLETPSSAEGGLAAQPKRPRQPVDQILREEYGRPWEEVPQAPATQAMAEESGSVARPRNQVSAEDAANLTRVRQFPNMEGRMNAAPGVSASTRVLGDVSNSIGGGVMGAATGAALPADSEEDRRRNALIGAGVGMVAGPVAGRMLPREGGARVSPGVGPNANRGYAGSPNYAPPTAAQLQRATQQGAQRGANLNRGVTAPPSAVPGRVRAATAATDDRAALRWAEDMLTDTAGSPRMRENDPARPSTQSRINAGSVANERITNDLEPAIVNAGRAGLQAELPQYLEDMHARDILNEFYRRGYQGVVDRWNQALATAQANGSSPNVIARIQQRIANQVPAEADRAGLAAMQRRAGGNAEHSYQAVEARLQAQEQRLTADGRWQQLQDSAQAVWDHNAETRDRLAAAGEMDPQQAADLAQRYPHYVPTVPVSHLENGGGGVVAGSGGPTVQRGTQRTVQALEDVGTSGERLNPIVASRNSTVKAERAIQRNNTARAFAQLMDDALQASPQTMGVNQPGQAAHRTFLGGGKDITYFENGQPVTISVPKVVADGLEAASNMSADPGTVGRIWKQIMGVVTSAMTAGRASFLPVNLLRDMQDYATRTAVAEGGVHRLPGVMGTWLDEAGRAVADIARAQANARGAAGAAIGAAGGAAVGDENTTVGERARHAVEGAVAGTFLLGANRVNATGRAAEYLARGGGSGGLSAHWGAGQRWYRDVQRTGGARITTPAEAVRHLADWGHDILTLQGVKGINERTELISRTAAMRRGDSQGLSPVEAMTRGRDASYDPDRAGTVARVINGIVPFFNASIQNGAQTVRLFRQNPAAAAVTIGATLAPVMGLAEAWNRSDPARAQAYDDVPQYIKDSGIVVMTPWAGSDARGERPNYVWIPTGVQTPFVIGLRAAMKNTPGLEPSSGRSENDWADTLGSMIQVFNPLRGDSIGATMSNLIPQGVKQGVELAVNRDFYRGRPIESDAADENASAASRVISDTANAAGRAVGNDWLQEVRPSGVEHVIRSMPAYSDIVTGASDMVAPSGFKQGEDRPTQNEPFVGGIAGRFIRDTGGANIQRAQDDRLSESVRTVLEDAGMRPSDVQAVSSRWHNGPLTRDEQLRWQEAMNTTLPQVIAQARRDPKWRDPATREAAVRGAISQAAQTAGERARLPSPEQMQQRIRREQSMKAS